MYYLGSSTTSIAWDIKALDREMTVVSWSSHAATCSVPRSGPSDRQKTATGPQPQPETTGPPVAVAWIYTSGWLRLRKIGLSTQPAGNQLQPPATSLLTNEILTKASYYVYIHVKYTSHLIAILFQ